MSFFKFLNKKDKYLKKILSYARNKYVLIGFCFVVWMLFFDQNSVIKRVGYQLQISKLEGDKVYYQKEADKLAAQIKLLKNDPDYVERFAREHYLMHKPGEQVFVFIKGE